jgi:predicted DCC family thiol-disulfide oxidoreductase YuxK
MPVDKHASSSTPRINASNSESASRRGDEHVDADGPIVFFDGVCGLCNRTVDFLLKRDTRGVFRFAPLQGETAQRLLTAADVESLNSLVFFDGTNLYRRSAGTVRIFWRLGGLWKVPAALLWLVPLPIRNAGYRAIAAYRYRWFGKKETCRMPTPEERERFLP